MDFMTVQKNLKRINKTIISTLVYLIISINVHQISIILMFSCFYAHELEYKLNISLNKSPYTFDVEFELKKINQNIFDFTLNSIFTFK